MQLMPSTSRLTATTTLVASALFVAPYLSSTSSPYAYAAEIDSPSSADHNHHRLGQGALPHTELFGGEEGEEEGDLARRGDEGYVSYEPEFWGLGRDLIGRATTDALVELGNNRPAYDTISANSSLFFHFKNSSLWGNYSAATPGLPSIVDKRSLADQDEGYKTELKKRALDARKDKDDGDEDQKGSSKEDDDKDGEGDEEGKKGNGNDQTGDGDDDGEQESLGSRLVYITVNVCRQPTSNNTAAADLPQLTMYISTSSKNKNPGPDSNAGEQATATLTGGFASYTTRANSDVYVGLSTPELPQNYSGHWTYELAASIDQSFHRFNERDPTNAFVYLVDSDTTSALFTTDNLTQANADDPVYQEWMKTGTPFQVYAYNTNSTVIKGLERSFCGLQRAWADQPTSLSNGMTTRGSGNKPKEQFYLMGLNGSTEYFGYPVMYGNSTATGPGVVGGGGQVWSPVTFRTKRDHNCQVIFDLDFCSEVAYAVPSNPSRYNMNSLRTLYDDNAAELYQNFNYSLQQIPCNTTTTAQYSLARTCDDCARDYKNWLCAVTIPRCDDFSSPHTWLQPRNVGAPFLDGHTLDDADWSRDRDPDTNATLTDRLYANSSRNSLIDDKVQPGPYKEVLPCEDLCYSLVQSCPAQFGFACPSRGRGLEHSYGNRDGIGSSNITCSYLGAFYYVNAAGAVAARRALVLGVALVVGVVLGAA
ncbi:uncharacterized protein K452DRAFT_263407 [Aplosporella prunicola CBS 121167]|uniref:FZ domain-containing protein n=1 Tax=Aplosporella prunicola CBS 121167 TaxID=1176127 RepID=A0A6A6BPB8_9PEZI|nr:uncharacterized protein K452DRAFT_263407 [Aplosporella prunicola CBS 121167]KAF2145970.1 hypothetical protein K452DRAFT_263407 [Aplosporella prunicola CBS 121167]